MTTFVYRTGAELPGLTFHWQEQTEPGTWADLDLSAGWTFTLELVRNGITELTKTTGIVGGDGQVVVAWDEGELALPPGTYVVHLRARETATGKDRDYAPGDPVQIRITT